MCDAGPPTEARDSTLNPPPGAEGDSSAVAPRRLHPAGIVLDTLKVVRSLGLPTLFLLIGAVNRLGPLVIPAVFLFALLCAALAAAMWWRFRYELTANELRVRSGLIARQERLVPRERIQVVDISENVLQRLLGIVSVKVETAAGGSAKSDVSLDALTRTEAEQLRTLLLTSRTNVGAVPGEPAAAQAAPATARLIRALSGRELFIAGATSGRVGPALVIVFGALQFADDIVPDGSWDRIVEFLPAATVATVLGAVLVFGIGAWLLAVGSTVLTFANFELRREGDRLFVSHGLLDRRRSTIPLARIQAVTVQESLLRQPFGLCTVRVESAGYGKDTAASGVLFPLLRRTELSALLDAACPAYATDLAGVPLARPPVRAARRYITAQMWALVEIPVIAVLITAWASRFPWWGGLFALAVMAPGALLGWARYRDTGWAMDEVGRFIVRGRGLARTTTITAGRRLQRRDVQRNPFQRRARLATFSAAVASGGSGGALAIPHMEESDAFALWERLGARS